MKAKMLALALLSLLLCGCAFTSSFPPANSRADEDRKIPILVYRRIDSGDDGAAAAKPMKTTTSLFYFRLDTNALELDTDALEAVSDLELELRRACNIEAGRWCWENLCQMVLPGYGMPIGNCFSKCNWRRSCEKEAARLANEFADGAN